MAAIKFFRETALPAIPVADAVYFIANPATPDHLEVYVANSAGVVKRAPTTADITAQVNTAIAQAGNLSVVANIAARNALSPASPVLVLVRDATGDATVQAGAATYVYDFANTVWVKVNEFESLDINLDWAGITNKPTSTVAAIDAAVVASHTHLNKTQLDSIGQDANSNLTYGGNLPHAGWDSVGW
jgi:hypothetical protein